MEQIIISILLAVSLYQIDYLSQPNYIWLLIYIIGIILYIFGIKKIDNILNIKKSLIAKMNNFLIHISFTVLLLILVYWINWASLGEWKILHYSYIQYLVFIVFLIPIFLWYKIILIKNYFKNFTQKFIFTLIYFISPVYFYFLSKNLSLNKSEISTYKVDKIKLMIVISFLWLIISLLWFYIIITSEYVTFYLQNKTNDSNRVIHRFDK